MADHPDWDDEDRQRRERGYAEGPTRDYRRPADQGRRDERRHYGAGDYEQARGEGYYYERRLRPYEEDRYRYARDESDRWERPYGAGDYELRRRAGSFDGRSRSGDSFYGRGEPRGEHRSFWDRAGDEVASWFGDRHAEQRREADGAHRGRGPKGYKRSDDRIREDVNDRLTDDAWLDARAIEVEVKNGEVTLNGVVVNREDKRRAEDLTERVSGVDHVQNNLRVDRSASAEPADSATRTPIDPAF